ncbi:MAG: phosphatidate cytidylyltransferase [Clostridia bacterium]|nr:phosphatidate cytidylyltransferase [Clostridia bacterium]
MKTRIISSLIMLPLLVLVVLGGIPLFIGIAAVSFIAMYEFYKGFGHMGMHPVRPAGYAFAAMLFGIIYVWLFVGEDAGKLSESLLLWLFITTVGGLALGLFLKKHDIIDGLLTIIGVIYLPFFYVHVALLDNLQENASLVWLVFITAFGTDIFAYFAGVYLGKHKLCPDISPKKTVEGSLGGILGSTIISAIFVAIVCPQHIAGGFVMGFLGSFFAQCGDLIASAFKRKMGIKDYGNLIPGHGGILDRFDSVVLTAPFIYYYVVLFINR